MTMHSVKVPPPTRVVDERRFVVKLEQLPSGNWCATLYSDPLNKSLRSTGESVVESTRGEALAAIAKVRDHLLSPASEPEWVRLDV